MNRTGGKFAATICALAIALPISGHGEAAEASGVVSLDVAESLRLNTLSMTLSACRFSATGQPVHYEAMVRHHDLIREGMALLRDGDPINDVRQVRAPGPVRALEEFGTALQAVAPFVDYAARGALPPAYLGHLNTTATVAADEAGDVFAEVADVYALHRVTRYESATIKNIARLEEIVIETATAHCLGETGIDAEAQRRLIEDRSAEFNERLAWARAGYETGFILEPADFVTASLTCVESSFLSMQAAIGTGADITAMIEIVDAAIAASHEALLAVEHQMTETVFDASACSVS
ncbi:MAG: hypothetical protein ACPGID_00395 [Rubricella sp.]